MFLMLVIPAKAGIQSNLYLDPGFHRDDRRRVPAQLRFNYSTIFLFPILRPRLVRGMQ
jgi:hypothetical protein